MTEPDIYIYLILFLAMLGLCCCMQGFCWGDYSLEAVLGLLIVLASLVQPRS